LRLLIKLAAASELLPDNLYIANTFLEDGRDPSRLGGFSDVFRANLNGNIVALKRIRIYAAGAIKKDMIRVSYYNALLYVTRD
jgi:hypothetical protein